MKTSGNKSIVGFMGFWMFLAGLLLSGMPLPAGSFAQEKPETEKTIIMGASRELAPGEKDPYYCTYTLKVWEPLIENGQDGEPKPKLAVAWLPNSDYTEWTFKLRDGVSFHDGEKFDADAVVTNVKHWLDFPGSRKPSPFYTFDMKAVYPGFQKIEKLDALTVKFHFEKPVSTLPYYMTNFGSPMYSPRCFDGTQEGDFNGLPQGTGPFRLVEAVRGQHLVLERNENYWGQKSGASRIRINIIPDANTRFSALKSEEIMGVLDLGGITPTLARELAKDPRFHVASCISSVPHFLSVNHKHFPLDDVRVRQAISLAIDRDTINESFFGGYCFPTANILSAASPFSKKIPITHDLEKARRLVAEALEGKREKIDILIPSGMLAREPYKELAEYLQAVLADIGLDATITIMDTAAATEHRRSGRFDTVLHTSGMPNSEPFTVLEGRMYGTGSSNTVYGCGYYNKEAEALIDSIRNEPDMVKRREVYNRLQDLAAEDLPAIPLLDGCWLTVNNVKLTGYGPERYGQTLETLRWVK